MPVEIRVPSVGESITEVQIGAWLKAEGQSVSADDPIAEIESDKATLELPAPVSGSITQILKKTGETAKVGDVIGYMEEGAVSAPAAKSAAAPKAKEPAPKPRVEAAPVPAPAKIEAPVETAEKSTIVMPAAQRVMSEHGLSAEDIKASGPGGRILKEDVEKHIKTSTVTSTKTEQAPVLIHHDAPPPDSSDSRQEEIKPMSPMRRTIAERLVQAQQNAALLTTFNEVNMQPVMDLRQSHQDQFVKKYGVKLGFMSFFVKAAVDALRQIPAVNAEIRGTDVVYRNYFDIGIAISGGKGLVVPVLRNAELMSFADVEQAIAEFGARAKENKISLEELKGGTFSITNGGIFGSMLSTPIINPPQSAILGMHAITDRPVAENGQVVIRPMMYVALTYDHRIIDGREAVTFLKRIKECVENPTRMLLEI